MVLYTQNYYDKIKKQKNFNFAVFLTLIIAFVLFEGFIIYYNSTLPYASKISEVLKKVLLISCVLFCFIISFFYSVNYLTVKTYFKVISKVLSGKKEILLFTVIKFNKEILTKDNVDCYTLIGLIWSDLEEDYVERKLYLDAEFKDLNFEKGQILNILTSSSFILELEELDCEKN